MNTIHCKKCGSEEKEECLMGVGVFTYCPICDVTVKSEEPGEYVASEPIKLPVPPVRISCSSDAIKYIKGNYPGPFWEHSIKQEVFGVLSLNNKNEPIEVKCLFIGRDNECSASVKTFFQYLVECDATRFIIFHNHPSGDPTPSAEDILMSKRIKDAGDIFGIQMLDSVILTTYSTYCSLIDSAHI